MSLIKHFFSLGKLTHSLSGHSDSVYSIAFSPDGKSLTSGSLDKTLKTWDLTVLGRENRGSTRGVTTLSGHKDFVLSVVYSNEGEWIASGSKDRTIQFWDPRVGGTFMVLQGHKNSIISLSANPRKPSFASGSGDHRARIWNYSSVSGGGL